MPCQGGPTERENLTAARSAVDQLTAENDRLRELILRLVDGETITKQELQRVQRDQIAHRKEDLTRLRTTLLAMIAKALDRGLTPERFYMQLGRVVAADPTRPLEPQLGFDPDSI